MSGSTITRGILTDPCEQVLLDPFLQRAERDLANTLFASITTCPCKQEAMTSLAALLRAEVDDTLSMLCAHELANKNPLWALDPRLAPELAVADARQSLARHLQETNLATVDEAAPLLRDVLGLRTKRFTAVTAELCERMGRNRNGVARELFGSRDIGKITAISSQMGDSHNGGRSTTVITCEAGRFVYKPHDCRIDAWFASIARNYMSGAFAQPKTIVCEDANGAWGIQQYMERRAVANEEGLARYWHNMGRAMALFQALGSEDMHCENVVAVGEHPSLIDAETVLTCEPLVLGNPLASPSPNHVLSGFEHDLALTLVKSGLMPSPQNKTDNSSPLLAHGYNCLPMLGTSEHDVRGHEDNLLAGFEEGLALLAERREELARDVMRVANVLVRGLVRNTQLYARLLRRLQRSDAFTAQKREALLGQLRTHVAHGGESTRLDLVAGEISSLREGDIPIFHAEAGSHAVMGADGTSYQHALTSSAMERALARIQSLDEAHRTFCVEVLDANLHRAYLPDDTLIPPRDRSATPLTSQETIAAAHEVFWDLEKLVLHAPSGEASWLFRNAKYGILMSSTVSLADGLGGVAVFLATLAARTNNSQTRKRALLRIHDCLSRIDTALALLEEVPVVLEASVPWGLASGIGGVVRSLDHMVRELGHRDGFGQEAQRSEGLLLRLLSIVERCDIEHALHAGVYDGLSGLLLAIGGCHTMRQEPRTRTMAERLVRRLLEIRNLAAKDGTILWRTGDAKWPVSGFGHGQAGIAAALATAAEAFELDVADAVRDALAWEVHTYDEKLGSWPDLRESPLSTTCMHGICSGAPGIGLASLMAARLDNVAVRELAHALLELSDRACLELAPPSRDTLCCGGLAVAEYLLTRGLRAEAGGIIAGTVGRRRSLGGYVFTHDGMRMTDEPDLFDGLSGVGYALLRYADPNTCSLFAL